MKPSTRLLRLLFVWACISWAIGIRAQSGPYDVAPTNGHHSFSYNQTPEDLVSVNPANDNGMNFQWYMSTTPFGAGQVVGGNTPTYHFTAPLQQTVWITRVAWNYSYSHNSAPVRMDVVSAYWEDLNYVREHDVLVPGQTDWKAIDQLPIGQKLQTTTYIDGMGRPIQKVSRETATPANPNDPNALWGDMVQFSQYDALGRQPNGYLPYTTTGSGKYKSNPQSEQSNYYTNNYNETAAFSRVALYDNSPLNRILRANQPGTNWTNSNGDQAAYELNDASDNVQVFTIGYNTGDYPVSLGTYPNSTLFRSRHIDENGHQVVDYTNMSGQLVLTKTQIDDNPTTAHAGWICTYSVYDDFGLLRYRIQPEAVKWLDQNGWNFAVNGGATVLDGLCFRYEYDAKKRNILKKAPGAQPLNMLYDSRDRAVFMQDGNQDANGEWTANLYDNLDRTVMVALYHPNKTRAQLQDDITAADNTNAAASTTGSSSQPVNDLDVRERIAGVASYTARTSITFEPTNPGFTSEDGAEFTAYIDPNASTQGSGTTTPATYGSPISPGNLASATVTTIVKYLYYDDYSFAGAQSFTSGYDNTQAYPASAGDPIATDPRTLSMPTGTKVRALGTATFLATTIYYDVEGRPVQSNSGNIKGGQDVTTHQYQWDGRLLSSNTRHTAPGTAFANYSIITKNNFDKLGRVISLQKNYGGSGFKSIASYDYDDMGRLKTKHLDPGYTNPTTGNAEMESLTYSYNIHNQITGINKDYALKAGSYSKWGHYFGLYLGYDDHTNFSQWQLDGHVAGQLWSTQGDDAQRKYSYTYDNAGRLARADFLELNPAVGQSGQNWNNGKLDFSVTGHGTNYTIQYDLNGNLQSMVQRGVIIGKGTVNMDDLLYGYLDHSNKLKWVSDAASDPAQMGTANGSLGDFKDGGNGGANDYVFDANGNLVIDLNKNVQDGNGGSGITYNFLDKPEQITIQGKGVINILYDADGDKLQRTYTPTGGATVTTTYIGGFVYQGNNLQFINFEEGRLRSLPYTSTGTTYNNQTVDALQINGSMDLPGGMRGAYDFFIRDYQQNVRMIVTEETHVGYNTATMETDRDAVEDPMFQGSNAEREGSKYARPSGWSSNASNWASKLNNATAKVGPNSLLKVMAGDQVSATTDYYYEPGSNTSGTVAGSVLNSLLGALAGGGANLPMGVEGGANATAITGQLGLDGNFNDYVNSPNGYNGPKAYLNVLFFDERFQFIRENSQSVPVSQAGDGAPQLVLAGIKAPKNGYAYIYVSNASDQDVFFDNLKVADERGRLIEEDHYYAYGLKIAGLSSKKLDVGIEGHLSNNYLYQGAFSEFDEDLGWNDFALRSYDPQTGRWLQMDPYDQFASPYVGMGNNPVSFTDPSGGGIGDVLSETYPTVFVNAARVAPQAARVLGLGARVFATVATQVTRYMYSNATSQLTTSTYHNESFIDNESNEQMNLTGTSTETYYQQVDVTGEYLQAQKSAMEKAMALDKLNSDFAKLHAFTLAWDGGSTKMYRNAVGETRTTGTPESLGNDLVGQAFGAYAMGGYAMFGRRAVVEEGMLTFYRGTNYYDALEVGANQAFDAGKITANQIQAGFTQDRLGLYLTTQEETAGAYANATEGRFGSSGGQMLKVEISSSNFSSFASKYGIKFEIPTPQPPFLSNYIQTETLIPSHAINDFNSLIKISLHP